MGEGPWLSDEPNSLTDEWPQPIGEGWGDSAGGVVRFVATAGVAHAHALSQPIQPRAFAAHFDVAVALQRGGDDVAAEGHFDAVDPFEQFAQAQEAAA